MSKCIIYEAQMGYLRIPSLPLVNDVKDVKDESHWEK